MRRADLLWVPVFVLASASLQAIQTVPFDGDTAYHVAVARLIAEHGVLEEFPWTRFSILADHYADKELFFHFLLVPVSHLPYPLAAKLVGTLLGTSLLALFYWILRQEGVEYPGLWTIAMLVSSGAFLMRFALLRPHLLSIPLLLAIAWAAIHERRRVLGLLCFLYPFCYIAWHAVLILLLLLEAARLLAMRRVSIRNLAIATGAIALAVLAHPNFPANVQFFWIVNVEELVQKAWGDAAGFALGQELAPMGPQAALRFATAPLLVVGMALLPALRRRGESLSGFAFGVAAIAFVGLAFRSIRFVEYAVPFCFLAGATSLRSLRKTALLALIVAMSVATLLFGSQRLREFPLRRNLFPSERAETMRKIIPEGAHVFTCGWELTGEMMIALPERRFLVALDPVLFWAKDADLYRTWFNAVHSPPADVATIIRTRFQSGFVLCEARPKHVPLIRRLYESPGVKVAHQIGVWALFVLEDPG